MSPACQRHGTGGVWFPIVAVLCFLASAHTVSAAAKTARILYLHGAEVRDAEIDGIRSLVESNLLEDREASVLFHQGPHEDEAQITGLVTRLGERYLLILTARRADAEECSHKQYVASFDEIGVVSQRLVASVVGNAEVFDTVERGAVFQEQREPEDVVEADVEFELGFGFAGRFATLSAATAPFGVEIQRPFQVQENA